MKTVWLPLFASLSLVGCGSFTGLGGSSEYACKAPDGVLCASVSGVYANSVQNNLPAQRAAQHTPAAAKADNKTEAENSPYAPYGAGSQPATTDGHQAAKTEPYVHPDTLISLSSGMPIRTEPKVIRAWIAPWKDSDGDLHDQQHLYLTVDFGDWQLQQSQKRIRDAFSPKKGKNE